MIKYSIIFFAFYTFSCSSMIKEFLITRKPASLKMLAARSIIKEKVTYEPHLPTEIKEYVNFLKDNSGSMDMLLQKSIMNHTEHFEDLLLLSNAKKRKFNKDQLCKKLMTTSILFGNAGTAHYLLDCGAELDMKLDKKGVAIVGYAACNPELNTFTEKWLDSYTDRELYEQRCTEVLKKASRVGNTALMEIVLTDGCDIKSKTSKGSSLGASALNRAICAHQNKAIDLLLRAGVDPNEAKIDKYQSPHKIPLYQALDRKNFQAVRQLVEHGANVKIGRYFYGGSCIEKVRDTETIAYLLEKGANINQEEINGGTPLNWAASYGKPELVEYLLYKNACVNQQNKHGETALYQAAYKGKIEIVQKLFKAGANPHIKTNKGLVFLTRAAEYGHSELVKLILEQSIEETFKDQQEFHLLDSLSWVKPKGYQCCISLLKNTLLNKSFIPLREKLGLFDPKIEMITALFADDVEAVAHCIQKGIPINSSLNAANRLTPLMIALYANASKTVHYLLSHDASIHKQNERDITILTCAINANNPEHIRLLLKYGADINERDVTERPVFFRAVNNGSIEVCSALLGCKNLDINAEYHTSALEIAIESGNLELIKMILNDGRLSKPLCAGVFWQTIKTANLDLIKLVAQSADINCHDFYIDNNTPLISAVYYDEKGDIINFLLDQKADFSKKNKYGMTAFLTAVSENNPKVLELLLKHDPKQVNAQANGGYTALMFATFYHYKELIILLLKHGADPFIKDAKGRTALMYAYLRGNDVIAELLKDGMRNYKKK